MLDYAVLSLAAFMAGMIDAVVGGGGLIQIPALFSVLSGTAPATLLGTSKLAGIWGSAAAAMNYVRRVRVEWSAAIPAAIAAFSFAFAGAYTVSHVPPDLVSRLLPFVLVLVGIYTFKNKELGMLHAPLHSGWQEKAIAIVMGGAIGFYDGFFGPGTGSFLLFLFVRFFGFDFLGASAAAKVVNVACNLAALLWFGYAGYLIWQIGLLMAIFNVAGALIGSKLALHYGSGLVRKIFLMMLILLTIKTSYDAFFK